MLHCPSQQIDCAPSSVLIEAPHAARVIDPQTRIERASHTNPVCTWLVARRVVLGTILYAILCAASSLSGNLVVGFADTLFRAEFKINSDHEAIIWVSNVEDPSSFVSSPTSLVVNTTHSVYSKSTTHFSASHACLKG